MQNLASNALKNLSTLDYIVFLFVTGLSVGVLIWSHLRRTKSDEFDWIDYLLMGRQLSLPLFTASLVATWYGGVFGVTRISFESGIFNFVSQGVFWYIAYFVFAIFMVDRIRKTKAITLADMIGKEFGPKSEKLAAVFNLFNVIPVVYLISFGILVSSLFAISFVFSCVIGLAIIILYTSFGGLRAVVLTDSVQFGLMFIGAGSVIYFSVVEFGGYAYLSSKLPTAHFSVTGGHGIGELFVWGMIAFSTLVDPNFYHRVFAAGSTEIAKKGILISIGFWFIFDVFTTLGGMYAKAAIPNAPAEQAYLLYTMELLPSGLRGLFLGGITACILSTLDSYLFTASNTLLYDLLPKGLHLKKRNHILSNVFVGLLALALALYFEGNIKSVWKTLGSYSAACLLFPVLFFRFGKVKISDNQFITSCLFSVVVVSLWRNLNSGYFTQFFDELYAGVLASAICFLFFSYKNSQRSKA